MDRQTAEYILGHSVDAETWQSIEFLDSLAQDNEYLGANGLSKSANYDYGDDLKRAG